MLLTPIEAASAKFSALADSIGVKHIRAFLENHPPSHLFKHYLILPTSQSRAFHTLSNNILFLQPVRAEILFHTFSKIILFSQPAKAELSTPSQTIFYSSSQSGQKNFSHLLKQYFIFPASQGRAFHTLSSNTLFLQPVRAAILFCPDWLEE